jgi:hypothetical protein
MKILHSNTKQNKKNIAQQQNTEVKTLLHTNSLGIESFNQNTISHRIQATIEK